ncbi:peptidase [Natrinema salaciae]|uniref:Zn-dependent protease with chaperone function n=1 Tax=Natrinema salaciae TaxID=1186196 RepID=A0A1H9MDT1_9EURY|nr:peptidase [Natrinema salaciae]SER21814.1 Zn-dependent protease with chaperone function [Natrinema salaciae]
MIGIVTRWLGLLVVGYVAGRLYGRYAIRRADDEHRSRGTYRLLTVVGLTTLSALVFSGLLGATETALSAVHPALSGGLAASLAWGATGIGTIVAVLVTYLGVFPYARERRDLEISAATALIRLAKYLVAIGIFCVGVIALLTVLLGASDPDPRLIPVVLLVLVVGIYAWVQHAVRLSQDVSEPTAEQRRRLEAAADRADLTAVIAGVFPGRETEVAAVYLDGPFWNRRAYATDYALEILDDDELTALCARVDAADERWLLERRTLVAALLFGAFVVLTVWASLALALVGLLVGWPLLARHLQRCEFAADRRAASEVGVDTFANACEAGRDLAAGRSRILERLATRPSTARRLERLRKLES